MIGREKTSPAPRRGRRGKVPSRTSFARTQGRAGARPSWVTGSRTGPSGPWSPFSPWWLPLPSGRPLGDQRGASQGLRPGSPSAAAPRPLCDHSAVATSSFSGMAGLEARPPASGQHAISFHFHRASLGAENARSKRLASQGPQTDFSRRGPVFVGLLVPSVAAARLTSRRHRRRPWPAPCQQTGLWSSRDRGRWRAPGLPFTGRSYGEAALLLD